MRPLYIIIDLHSRVQPGMFSHSVLAFQVVLLISLDFRKITFLTALGSIGSCFFQTYKGEREKD